MAFLEAVAQKYIDHEASQLRHYCFVFPNKRSAIFFNHYLQNIIPETPKPHVTTLNELVTTLSGLKEGEHLDLLLLLYQCYSRLSKVIPDFDTFYSWGETLLNDFDDIDQYLADPEVLMTNVARLKEINASYLTPAQAEIIRQYWGENRISSEEATRFWSHIDKDKTYPARFLKLWEILYPLYTYFQQELSDRKLATRGMMLKKALQVLEEDDLNKLRYQRYIFVGFNVLHLGHAKLMQLLQKADRADFYWDVNSPAFRSMGSMLNRMLQNSVKCFPSRYPLDEPEVDSFPRIEIESIASATGMAKRAGEIIKEWICAGKILEGENALNTAVILPDPALLFATIHSIPEEINNLNVTMNYQLSFSGVATLINKIIELHTTSTTTDSGTTFLHKKVKAILVNPLILSTFPDSCHELQKHFDLAPKYHVPAAELTEIAPELTFIFTPINEDENILDFLLSVTSTLNEILSQRDDSRYDALFLEHLVKAINQIKQAFETKGTPASDITLLTILRRYLRSAQVPLEGEPLIGLQIMGMLETQSIDFDNIIVLSMNEGIYPQSSFTRSFIPDVLRHAYGLNTSLMKESTYAYQFFRLLSRCKNVVLMYDSRQGGLASGEPSRYLQQLEYLYPGADIEKTVVNFNRPQAKTPEFEIRKTPWILERLKRYFYNPEISVDNQPGYLSPSSINGYLSCELKFFFAHIVGLKEEKQVTDFMDSATYGTITHAVCQRLYTGENTDRKNQRITRSFLDNLISHPQLWSKLITREINATFFHLPEKDLLKPLNVETRILAEIIQGIIISMLKQDRQLLKDDNDYFTLVDAEKKCYLTWQVTPEQAVNLTMTIDRIDCNSAGLTRIVDYKTGGDELSVNDWETAFGNQSSKYKAITQLFMYCNGYNSMSGGDIPIQPLIYPLGRLSVIDVAPLKINKKDVEDYHTENPEFLTRLNNRLADLFNPDYSFHQTSNSDNCKYCPYIEICGKSPK